MVVGLDFSPAMLTIANRNASSYWKRTLIYLANTILKSASVGETAETLPGAGFRRTLSEKMTLGVAAFVVRNSGRSLSWE